MEKKNRVLLVGASGRLGRMVLHHWRAAPSAPPFDVVPQYRAAPASAPAPGAASGAGVAWSPLDGPDALVDHVARTGPIGAMVSLAGVCPGPGRDPALNEPLARACLGAARAAGIGRVLLSSSSAIYGPGDGTPFAEGDPLRPAGEYGRAKRAMEAACEEWRAEGMEICCLRIGNVAGADALMTNIVRAGPGGTVAIDAFEDGTGPVRSYIGARTLAEVLATLVTRGPGLPPALNVAAPRPIAMEALARAGKHRYTLRPAPPAAHRRVTLDCGLLAGLHGFREGDGDPGGMLAQWRETLA